jgi:multicomponent Na+:H+ antiporter subunit E
VNLFAWNLVLALAWTLLTADFSLVNLLTGFVLSYGALYIAQRAIGPSDYFYKVFQVLGFAAYFFVQIIRANLRVAYDVMTPTHYMRPGVVAIPLEAETDLEITVLANLISLTPGTLSLDVSTDRSVLYIHAMYIDDLEGVRSEIKDFERRVLKILR